MRVPTRLCMALAEHIRPTTLAGPHRLLSVPALGYMWWSRLRRRQSSGLQCAGRQTGSQPANRPHEGRQPVHGQHLGRAASASNQIILSIFLGPVRYLSRQASTRKYVTVVKSLRRLLVPVYRPRCSLLITHKGGADGFAVQRLVVEVVGWVGRVDALAAAGGADVRAVDL